MLGAAPRTRLYGAVVLIEQSLLSWRPSNAVGRSLGETSAAAGPAKLWAIELSGKSRCASPSVALPELRERRHQRRRDHPERLDHGATQRAVQAGQANGVADRRAEGAPEEARPRARPPQACLGAAAGADSCAVVVPDAATARAWIRRGSVRYVVLRVASPQAFRRLKLITSNPVVDVTRGDRDRAAAVVRRTVGATVGTAIAAAATGGPDLAVTAEGGSSSPALSSYLGMLDAATTASKQPASASQPDTTPPVAPAGIALLANGLDYITVGWADSTDNVAVTGYKYFLNGNSVGRPRTTT